MVDRVDGRARGSGLYGPGPAVTPPCVKDEDRTDRKVGTDRGPRDHPAPAARSVRDPFQ